MGIAEVVPQLNQCCCGCQLRTGSKFVGWCGVIAGIIFFICCLLVVLGVIIIPNEDNSPVTPEQLKASKIEYSFETILFLLVVLFSIPLLIGVYQEKVSYYLPWIIFFVVLTIVDISRLILQQREFPVIIVTLFGLCIRLYFMLVVYSDYRQQKKRGQGGP